MAAAPVLVVLAVLALLGGGTTRAAGAPADVPGPGCLLPPVEAPVIDPYRAPPCPYCAGHRGITFDTEAGAPVRAAAGGTVVFRGVVAGVRYVVVAHAGGWRTTYGHLAVATVDVGRPVAAGDVIALAADDVHFGLRLGADYVDPTPYLGESRRRARLVPLDGTPPRPGGSWVTLRCADRADVRRVVDGTVPSAALLRGVAARGPR